MSASGQETWLYKADVVQLLQTSPTPIPSNSPQSYFWHLLGLLAFDQDIWLFVDDIAKVLQTLSPKKLLLGMAQECS